MFTGIIESFGEIVSTKAHGSNLELCIRCDFTKELQVDQSIAHNGICLTVTEITDDTYRVQAIEETLKRTNLGQAKTGDRVNLERCLAIGDRLDGHFVQGHVDTTATCLSVEDRDGSWLFRFECNDDPGGLIIPKGSITVNGISLTVVETNDRQFSVAIIPYTFDHTNLSHVKQGGLVNIEFDLIGKYLRNFSANK
ncbi:MAG: riboflavin synthase [Flavobacteriales bacterium]|nr:riboflavin synthase [Flavobacteriales bacterium]